MPSDFSMIISSMLHFSKSGIFLNISGLGFSNLGLVLKMRFIDSSPTRYWFRFLNESVKNFFNWISFCLSGGLSLAFTIMNLHRGLWFRSSKWGTFDNLSFEDWPISTLTCSSSKLSILFALSVEPWFIVLVGTFPSPWWVSSSWISCSVW